VTAGESFVVDTSVAIKWIVDEEDSDKAELLQGADMVAPALFRIEAGNVLRTLAAKQTLANDRAIDLFLFLQTAPVAIIDADELLERRALVSTAATKPATGRRKTRPVSGCRAPWRVRSADSWRVPWRMGPSGPIPVVVGQDLVDGFRALLCASR
jgi:hypothetical protein